MLRILSNRQLAASCEGAPNRREFLRVGALGLGGLALPQIFAARAGAREATQYLTGKSVVMLNLQGGPTHIETFDPKMTAPSEYRAMYGEVETALPGVTFGSHFPRLAKLAKKLAVVRSYAHGIGSHGPAAAHVAAGGNATGACMSSIFSRVAGTTNNATGIANSVVITPGLTGGAFKNLNAVPDRITQTGTLPSAYRPFDPSKGGAVLDDMILNVADGRFDDRRTLLRSLDELKRWADASGQVASASEFEQQAVDVILAGVSRAFDIEEEDPRLLDRYDTGGFTIPNGLEKKKKNGKAIPGFSPVALGRQMLLARRLCEAGCGFVTVTCTGWDMHGNAFGIDDGMPILGPAVDRAVSAFIEDLENRGLTDDILLVITGEFGRTPKINTKGGRDHWGRLCTLAFAGGGLKMGQVVGASDERAGEPAANPVSSNELLGTVMHTLMDIGQVRLRPDLPPDVLNALNGCRPIGELV